MKPWVKWTAAIGLGLVGAAVVAASGVFAASEVIRHQPWPKLPVTIEAVPGAPAGCAKPLTSSVFWAVTITDRLGS